MRDPSLDPTWLTRREIADLLDVSQRTVERWIAAGWLTPVSVHRGVHLYSADEAWAAELFARYRPGSPRRETP